MILENLVVIMYVCMHACMFTGVYISVCMYVVLCCVYVCMLYICDVYLYHVNAYSIQSNVFLHIRTQVLVQTHKSYFLNQTISRGVYGEPAPCGGVPTTDIAQGHRLLSGQVPIRDLICPNSRVIPYLELSTKIR